ncbi:SH2 domain containing 1A duplicate b isoform X1 [Esox lucius]|uniref:SH2 domain containing 1A duplicate b isoform X1 n=1 Tax=Esox lucius TaxID=8010 RepID=UPI0014769311|nr:SH2 domain containing 1A duplicate b isoform X1 [Esox lucius]
MSVASRRRTKRQRQDIQMVGTQDILPTYRAAASKVPCMDSRNQRRRISRRYLELTFKGYVYTYRLFMDGEGSWTAETAAGVERRYFRKIKNLISAFQKPDQGIATHLLYPVTVQINRNPDGMKRKKHPSSPPSTPSPVNPY